MKRFLTIACAASVSLVAFAGCSNDPTVTVTNGSSAPAVTFNQLDRVGRAGIKELYLPYAAHDAFNRAVPTTDVAQIAPQIDTFVTGSGHRSAAISQYVQALLAPDALVADLANPATSASYLGFETSGQIKVDCTGAAATAFGGRSLTDDVVNAMLGLTFGNLATSANLKAPTPNVVSGTTAVAIPADDGAEQDGRTGTANLTNQMVSCAGKGITPAQFPYLGAPI